MKTRISRRNLNSKAIWLLGLACVALPSVYSADAKDDSKKTEAASDEDLRNWIDVSAGANIIHGDKPAFQQRTGQPRDAWGGVTDFHYEQDVGKKGIFEIDGRGIFDAHNYSITLGVKDPDKGYVRAGFEEYSTYYDLSGGFYPRNQAFIDLYKGQTGEIDRTHIFFDAGLTLENKPKIRVRYDYDARDGDKNSTSWGNTTLTGGNGTRNIVPTRLTVNEDRHTFALDVSHQFGNTELGIGGRYMLSTYDNARYIARNPGEATQRFLTHREGVDMDMFNAHAFTDTDFNEQFKLTTAYSFTRMESDISGNRAIGATFNASPEPTALALFAGRQARDHGFVDLGGQANVDQHVANISLMYRPSDHFTLVPSLRVESQNQEGEEELIDVEVGTTAAKLVAADDVVNNRHRDFLDVTESLEARYTGLTNWVLYARAELLEGSGTLSERELFIEETIPTQIQRVTDSTRLTQKYVVGANWYPLRNLNLAGQAYHKVRDNDYDHVDDSSPAAAGLYPAFITDQKFTTEDANLRVTYRPLNNLSIVSRYDFQYTTIDSQMQKLPEVQSARSVSHIISESITWTPINRLYIQLAGSYAMDHLFSPADNLIPNRLQPSENDFYTANASVGYAISEKTDVTANYAYYLADNYDTTIVALGLPLGAGLEEHTVGAGVVHRFSKRVQLSAHYTYMTSHDDLSGGQNDYHAHLLSATLRYRF
jgi:hypothetical protein